MQTMPSRNTRSFLVKKTAFLLSTILLFSLSAAEIPSGYGFSSHLLWGDFAVRDQELAIARDAGAKFIRFDLLWYQAEPNPGTYDFRKLDAVLASTAQAKLEPLLIIGGPYPKWITGVPADHLNEYLALVRAVVSHTKGKVRFFEIVNEPNRRTHWNGTPDPDRYAALLKSVNRAVKECNPDAVVVHGGLARVPIDFLEKELANGMAGCFDIANVHPYCTQDFPERELPDRFARLKKTLSENGCGQKTIWATECGNPNGFIFPQQDFLKEGLRKLNVKPEELDAGYFDDPSWRYFSRTLNFDPAALAKFRSLQPLRMKDFVSFKGKLIILPPFRDFPAPYFAELLNFVRSGGILFAPFGEIPCSRLLERREKGIAVRELMPNEKKMLARMIAVRRQSGKFSGYEPADKVALPKWEMSFSGKVLDESNLDANDRITPLLFARHNKQRHPIAAVINFNSDWRGAVIAGSVWLAENDETVTEAHQAELLARNLLHLKAGGADAVFVYALPSRENHPGRGAHWGMLHKDLSPKPALTAFREFVKRCPASASRPVITTPGNEIRLARWQTQDRVAHYALWRVFGTEKVTLRCEGNLTECTDHLGRPVALDKEGTITLSEGVVYLAAPARIDLVGVKPEDPIAPSAGEIPDRR